VFLGSAIARLIILVVYLCIYYFVIDWTECSENIRKENEKEEQDILAIKKE